MSDYAARNKALERVEQKIRSSTTKIFSKYRDALTSATDFLDNFCESDPTPVQIIDFFKTLSNTEGGDDSMSKFFKAYVELIHECGETCEVELAHLRLSLALLVTAPNALNRLAVINSIEAIKEKLELALHRNSSEQKIKNMLGSVDFNFLDQLISLVHQIATSES